MTYVPPYIYIYIYIRTAPARICTPLIVSRSLRSLANKVRKKNGAEFSTSAYSNEQSAVPSFHQGQNSTLMSHSSHLQSQNSTLMSPLLIYSARIPPLHLQQTFKIKNKDKSTWIIHIVTHAQESHSISTIDLMFIHQKKKSLNIMYKFTTLSHFKNENNS